MGDISSASLGVSCLGREMDVAELLNCGDGVATWGKVTEHTLASELCHLLTVQSCMTHLDILIVRCLHLIRNHNSSVALGCIKLLPWKILPHPDP